MTDIHKQNPFTGLILAGDRGPGDPLPAYTGASCKAMVSIGGRPMLHRVIDTLDNAASIGDIWLSGPNAEHFNSDEILQTWQSEGRIHWQEPEKSPSISAHSLMKQFDSRTPFLLTTADHPLLRSSVVDQFCAQSFASGADVTVGVAPYALVREKFPAMKKTVHRFREKELCGCNLFAFVTPQGIEAARFWQKVERERKSPLKLVKMLGWQSIILYRTGRLSMDDALAKLSNLMGVKVGAVILPDGEAAVDVDTISDYQLVSGYLQPGR